MSGTADRSGGGDEFAPGTAVEVHNQFTREWTAGFEVEAAAPDGYRLRRSSDASVLPAVFACDAVRARDSSGRAPLPAAQPGRVARAHLDERL